MARDFMDYNGMVEDALRLVVRRAVERVIAEGLPGNHHFYISFRTDFAGVEIPDYLHARYPEEMTIVLQHQYGGLHCDDEKMGVTLNFNKVPEHLVVPFAAITAFADPSVNFGLQFHGTAMAANSARRNGPAAAAVKLQEQPADPAEAAPAPAASPDAAPDGGAKVVTLDAFRKKQ